MGRLKVLRTPSPAMVVACIALAVALSGASYAAIVLPKNSVGTKQLRNNAVKSPKIAPNQVTGDDVNEASLGTVSSAVSAANAANADSLDGLDSSSFARPAEAWHEVTEFGTFQCSNAELTQNVPWANRGGAYSTAAYFKDADGLVHLKGTVVAQCPPGWSYVAPPPATAYLILRLPQSYRPSQQMAYAVPAGTQRAQLFVDPGGGVNVYVYPPEQPSAVSGTAASFDGVSFRTS
jgi:hypothetical protein